MVASRLVKLFPVILLIVWWAGCGGPAGPAQGSPEWLWQAARESYNAGDFEKAFDHLEKIERIGNNPFVERARAWRAVLSAGRAAGHQEIAQAYADGWTYARTNKTEWVRHKAEHFREARRQAIHVIESYGFLIKGPSDQPVVLEFPYPKGNAAQVTEMDRVYKGLAIAEPLRATGHEKMLNRGLVRAVNSVLATADDSAAAQGAMKDGKAEVPRARFLVAVALALDKSSAVFERKNLDLPDELKMCRERALDAAKRALELKPDAATEKEAKKLVADIEKRMKAGPAKLGSTAR